MLQFDDEAGRGVVSDPHICGVFATLISAGELGRECEGIGKATSGWEQTPAEREGDPGCKWSKELRYRG